MRSGLTPVTSLPGGRDAWARRRRRIGPLLGDHLPETDFDHTTGRLVRLGDLALFGPRLDVWRAPTDNDRGDIGGALDGRWRALGLHRMRHRTISVTADAQSMVVRSRVAPAASDLALLVTYRWTGSDDDAVHLDLDVEPVGDWSFPIPRLGMLMELPADLAGVEWFGGGPGEAYADSRQAARWAVFTGRSTSYRLRTSTRRRTGTGLDVRWARITGPDAGGIEVRGEPTFALSVRRWTSADLEAARHTTDLAARDAVYVNIDLAQNGLGTASCGPGVLPQYQLLAHPVSFACTFVPLHKD